MSNIDMLKMFGKLFISKNIGQYHHLYSKSDVLLLAALFENFRKTCLQYYKLDT